MYLKKFVFTFAFMLLGLITYSYVFVFSKPVVEKDLRSQYLKAGNFELNLGDQSFSLKQLKGKPVVLYFGYTSCPDVCPVGLALIRDALNSSEDFQDIPAIFVTLDPERDTADKLREYVAFFHKNILPLRGSVEQVKSVIEAYGGFFRFVSQDDQPDTEEISYLVDHSTYYYLIDAQGDLIRVFDHSLTSLELAESLRTLL